MGTDEKNQYTYLDAGLDEDKKDHFTIAAVLCWIAAILLSIIFSIPALEGLKYNFSNTTCLLLMFMVFCYFMAILFTLKSLAIQKKIKAKRPVHKDELVTRTTSVHKKTIKKKKRKVKKNNTGQK